MSLIESEPIIANDLDILDQKISSQIGKISENPDSQATDFVKDYNNFRLKQMQEEHQLRKRLVVYILIFVGFYLLLPPLFIAFENRFGFHDTPIVVFTGTLLVSLISLVAIILKYLFQPSSQ